MNELKINEEEVLKALDTREYKPFEELLERTLQLDKLPEDHQRFFRMTYRNLLCSFSENNKTRMQELKDAIKEEFGEINEEAMKNLAENGLPQIGEHLADMINQAKEENGFKDVVYLAEKLKDYLPADIGFDFASETKGYVPHSDNFYYYMLVFNGEKFSIPGLYNGILIPFTDRVEDSKRKITSYYPILIKYTYFLDLLELVMVGQRNGKTEFVEIGKITRGDDFKKEADRAIMIALEFLKHSA